MAFTLSGTAMIIPDAANASCCSGESFQVLGGGERDGVVQNTLQMDLQGASAYLVWLSLGYLGTEQDFINFL